MCFLQSANHIAEAELRKSKIVQDYVFSEIHNPPCESGFVEG